MPIKMLFLHPSINIDFFPSNQWKENAQNPIKFTTTKFGSQFHHKMVHSFICSTAHYALIASLERNIRTFFWWKGMVRCWEKASTAPTSLFL
jgi:hypothetical protein